MSTTDKPDPNSRASHGLFSRIIRRWRLLLFLWLLALVPIVYAIYAIEQPRYEALSLLRVAAASPNLFEPSRPEQIDPKNVLPYMQTQVGLISSDRVLGPAVASREVANLSAITGSSEPIVDLRKRMTVAIVPDSYLIRVALELPDGKEAATILNAVVNSYLLYHGEHTRSGNSTLRKSLAEHLEEYKKQIGEKRDELRTLVQPKVISPHPGYRTAGTVTEEQSDRIAAEMVNAQVELVKAQSTLEATEAAAEAEKDPRLRQTLSDLRINVAALVKQKEYLAKYLDGLKIEKKGTTDVSFEAAFVNRQLEILLKDEAQISAHLKQLEFDSQRGEGRVTLVDNALPPRTPVNDRRFAYMAAAPVVMLLALMSVALCLPLRGSRAWAGE